MGYTFTTVITSTNKLRLIVVIIIGLGRKNVSTFTIALLDTKFNIVYVR